jgi:hypothetical protein
MTLGDKQRIFSLNLALLTIFAYERGYEFAQGDAKRDKRVFGEIGESKGYGHPRSAHKYKLAHDYDLFIKKVYQEDSEAHKELGDYWKALHPLNRWGGDFKSQDGNHYSMEHNGVM